MFMLYIVIVFELVSKKSSYIYEFVNSYTYILNGG